MADLNSMTKAELLDEAARLGVDGNDSNTKQELIDAIEAGGGGTAKKGADKDGPEEGQSEGELRKAARDAGTELLPGHQGNVMEEQLRSGEVTAEDLIGDQSAPEEPEDTSQIDGLIQAPKTTEQG